MIQQTQSQKQLLKFTPQQIQMLNLLHLTTYELEQKIKDEIEENPALEVSEYENEESSSPDDDSQDDNDMDSLDEFGDNGDFAQDYDDDTPNYKEKSEVDYSAADNFYSSPVVQTESFHERIKSQINLLPITESMNDKIHFLIDSLDDEGFLREELDELAYQYSFTNGVICETEDLELALKYIQKCEPAGIGARNLQECLLLQLDRSKQHEPYYALARQVLCNHIFEMENKNFDKIIRSMGIKYDDLKAVILLISKLSPKPNVFTENATNSNHVIPEYGIRNEDGRISVSLINKNFPELRLNETVVSMVETASHEVGMKRRNKTAITFYKNKLHSAQWFIEAIKQREDSMMKVMKAIVKFQYDFFLTGDFKSLKPMVLKNISEMVGLDVSTVSRVTSTKYVQTDFGTILLKTLFTEALAKENGDIVSNKEIQNIIRDMLTGEDKSSPLTDQEISESLKEKGYIVARRTVAKYRECIGIPIAKMRRSMV